MNREESAVPLAVGGVAPPRAVSATACGRALPTTRIPAYPYPRLIQDTPPARCRPRKLCLSSSRVLSHGTSELTPSLLPEHSVRRLSKIPTCRIHGMNSEAPPFSSSVSTLSQHGRPPSGDRPETVLRHQRPQLQRGAARALPTALPLAHQSGRHVEAAREHRPARMRAKPKRAYSVMPGDVSPRCPVHQAAGRRATGPPTSASPRFPSLPRTYLVVERFKALLDRDIRPIRPEGPLRPAASAKRSSEQVDPVIRFCYHHDVLSLLSNSCRTGSGMEDEGCPERVSPITSFPSTATLRVPAPGSRKDDTAWAARSRRPIARSPRSHCSAAWRW